MLLDINGIKEIIPHRYPFLLIDCIEEMEPLIVEALAQVGAVAVLSLEENKGKLAFFGGIDKAKFRKQVVPGDRLKLETEIIKCKGPMGVGTAGATVDGKVACEAEIKFMIG